TGLVEELIGEVRSVGRRSDDRAEKVVRRGRAAERSAYGGVVTRALALAMDAALTIVIFMSVVGVSAPVRPPVGGLRPAWLAGALLASAWLLIFATYFVLFWSTTGHTPGMRLLRVRVRRRDPGGGHPSVGRSIVRFVGLVLAIIPMFAGFVPVL